MSFLRSSTLSLLLAVCGCRGGGEHAALKDDGMAPSVPATVSSPLASKGSTNARLAKVLEFKNESYAVDGQAVHFKAAAPYVVIFFSGDITDAGNEVWRAVDRERATEPHPFAVKGGLAILAHRDVLRPVAELEAAAAAGKLPMIANLYRYAANNTAVFNQPGRIDLKLKAGTDAAAARQALATIGLRVVDDSGSYWKVEADPEAFVDEWAALAVLNAQAAALNIQWSEPSSYSSFSTQNAMGVSN